MLKGQKLTRSSDGIQVALYPMETMNTTQGPNGSTSHKGTENLDLAGKDSGIENAYASVDCKLVWKDTRSGNGLVFQSKSKVLLADNTIDYYHWSMWHDNDISDMKVGMEFKQGEIIYQEGNAGHSYGNHIHMGFAKGKYKSGYPLTKNSYGNWELYNEVPPQNILFINDTVIKNSGGLNWVTFKDVVVETPEPVEPKPVEPTPVVLKVGDSVWWEGHLHRDSYGSGSTTASYAKTKGLIDILNNNKCGVHIKSKGWVAKSQVTLIK